MLSQMGCVCTMPVGKVGEAVGAWIENIGEDAEITQGSEVNEGVHARKLWKMQGAVFYGYKIF